MVEYNCKGKGGAKLDTTVVMGNGEIVVREYPLQSVREGRRVEDCTLTVTNKRLIYKSSVKDRGIQSHEVKNIPISSVDTIKTTLSFKKKYSVLLITVSVVMMLLGALLAAEPIFDFLRLAMPGYVKYIGFGIASAGALLILLVLLMTRRRYSFSLAIGFLGYEETEHIVSGASSLMLRKLKKRSKERRERFRVNLDCDKLDDLAAELGALIVRFK